MNVITSPSLVFIRRWLAPFLSSYNTGLLSAYPLFSSVLVSLSRELCELKGLCLYRNQHHDGTTATTSFGDMAAAGRSLVFTALLLVMIGIDSARRTIWTQ